MSEKKVAQKTKHFLYTYRFYFLVPIILFAVLLFFVFFMENTFSDSPVQYAN